jgi:hypothetical protein
MEERNSHFSGGFDIREIRRTGAWMSLGTAT